MELDDYYKSLTRFHLGFNSGANMPADDFACLEEAMARIPDSVWYSKVIDHINRCENAYEVSEVLRDPTQPLPSRIESIIGDTNRAIFQSDPMRAAEIYREVYLRETDYLAETLYVPNYRREEYRRYVFQRFGTEFIQAIPGPADTAVGTRLMFNDHWR